MRQQDKLARRVAVRERPGQVLSVPLVGEASCRTVVDAGQIEARFIHADADAFIAEAANAEAGELRDPRRGAGEVLVVPRDEEDAMARPQPRQRGRHVAQVGHRAVDQIAGDRNQVRRQGIRLLDNLFDERSADRGADVQIRELDDRQSVQRARQSRQSDRYALHGNRADRRSHGDGGQRRRAGGDGASQSASDQRAAGQIDGFAGRRHPQPGPTKQLQKVRSQKQNEQDPGRSKPRVNRPAQQVGRRRESARQDNHGWQAEAEHDQDQQRSGSPWLGKPGITDQTSPDEVVQARQNGEGDAQKSRKAQDTPHKASGLTSSTRASSVVSMFKVLAQLSTLELRNVVGCIVYFFASALIVVFATPDE